MSSKIFYKFSSQEVGPIGEVVFSGQFLRLADLKRELIEKLSEGRSDYPEFDLEVTDSEKLQAFTDENQIVPKNATVFIRRIPVVNPYSRRGFYNAPQTNIAFTNAPPANVKVERSTSNDDFQDVFEGRQQIQAPISAVAPHADDLRTKDRREDEAIQQMALGANARAPGVPATGQRAPPRGFTRFVTRTEPGDISGTHAPVAPKPKKTGIPKELLAPPSESDDTSGRLQFKVDDTLFDQKVKTQGVKTMSIEEVQNRIAAKNSNIHVPDELRCKLTGELLKDAVKLPCCLQPCSLDKISNALISSGLICPLCKQSGISPDMLKADKILRDKVTGFLLEIRTRLEKAELTGAAAPKIVKDDDVPLPSNNKSDVVLDLSSRHSSSVAQSNVLSASSSAVNGDESDVVPEQPLSSGQKAPPEASDASQRAETLALTSGGVTSGVMSQQPAYGMYPPRQAPGYQPYGGSGGYYPPPYQPQGWQPRGYGPPAFGWQGPPGPMPPMQPWNQPPPRQQYYPRQPPHWQPRPPRWAGPAMRGGYRPPFVPGPRPTHPLAYEQQPYPTEEQPQTDAEQQKSSKNASEKEPNYPESSQETQPQSTGNLAEKEETSINKSQGAVSGSEDRVPTKTTTETNRGERVRPRSSARRGQRRDRSPDRKRRHRSHEPSSRRHEQRRRSRSRDRFAGDSKKSVVKEDDRRGPRARDDPHREKRDRESGSSKHESMQRGHDRDVRNRDTDSRGTRREGDRETSRRASRHADVETRRDDDDRGKGNGDNRGPRDRPRGKATIAQTDTSRRGRNTASRGPDNSDDRKNSNNNQDELPTSTREGLAVEADERAESKGAGDDNRDDVEEGSAEDVVDHEDGSERGHKSEKDFQSKRRHRGGRNRRRGGSDRERKRTRN